MKIWAALLVFACACALPIGCAAGETTSSTAFSDVPEDHWAVEPVKELQDLGILKGYPDGEFKGDQVVTRYELAVILARMTELLAPTQATKPEPVKETSAPVIVPKPPVWAADALESLGTGKYLDTKSPIITDGSKPATVEDVAQALASISARIIEQRVPADPVDEE